MKITRAAAGASIDAPAGIQKMPGPGGLGGASPDYQLHVTMFKDTTGKPDRAVVVTSLTSNTIAVAEYKLLGNSWVFDAADCAADFSVTLQNTPDNQQHMTAFAIDSPGGTGDRVLFIAYNISGAPDVHAMDSIVLTPGSTTLTTTAVTITEDAADRQPDDLENLATVNIPLTTSTIMTILLDDAYFATITESAGTYTFTYDKAKVLAIDTTITASSTLAKNYSGIVIGTQVFLASLSAGVISSNAWELTTGAVLVESFEPFAAGISLYSGSPAQAPAAVTAIGGNFAIAGAIGATDAGVGIGWAYDIATFPLDDI